MLKLQQEDVAVATALLANMQNVALIRDTKPRSHPVCCLQLANSSGK